MKRPFDEVEWQGDHDILKEEKWDFETELRRLGYHPNEFVVVVRAGVGLRYSVFISQLGRPNATLILQGGEGRNWIAQFVENARHA